MKKISIAIIATLALGGCAITVPTSGSIQGTDETFKGVTTGYMSGSGTLDVISNKGANCTGNFVYVNGRQGDGILKCDDGRTGTFQFSSAGTHGIGVGEIAGKKFTFTFGN